MEGNRRENCLDTRSNVFRTFDRNRAHYIEILSHDKLETIR